MKRTLAAAAVLGFIGVVALINGEGFGAVTAAFTSVGAGILIVIGLRIVQMAGAGWAWWCLLPDDIRPPPWVCVQLRWVREAINTLLPVAQVGGEIAGARLLARTGARRDGDGPRLTGGLAGASVLVDLLTQTATQVAFALAGLALLVFGGAGQDSGLVRVIGVGLGLMALGVIGFYLAQKLGGFGILERWLLKAAEKPGFAFLGGAADLNEELAALHRAPGKLGLAFVLHLVMWFIGAFEIYVALRWMGATCGGGSCGYVESVVIESLGQAIRGAAFLIPGGLGAQEGGLIALAGLYGISAPAGLALSLVKRVPEIVLGLPGLLAWHRLESDVRTGNATGSAESSATKAPNAGANQATEV